MAYKNYKIRDNWLDIDKYNDVDIQSVDGVIQNVKVNGEDVGGGGSGGLSTAEVNVQVSGNAGNVIRFDEIVIIEDTPDGRLMTSYSNFAVSPSTSPKKFTIILVDGTYALGFSKTGVIGISGDAELLDDDVVLVHGDCTITIS